MIWRPSRLRKAAKWALGAVLYAQLALAAQACVMPTFRPAAAFSGADAMPFCEQMQAPVDVICLTQCLQADQAVDSPHVAAPLATASASWVHLAEFASPAPSPGAAPLSTGPPVYLSSHRLRL